MPDYETIYQTRAVDYDRLVAREDYQGNIVRAIEAIRPLAGSDVIEFGAGTGRLTSLLAPRVKSIIAYDHSAHMLVVARAKLERTGLHNWHLETADHRAVPAQSHSADLAIAGWTICYTVIDYEQTWQTELSTALTEMARVLRPGGAIMILETLGTGYTEPHPPAELAQYYAFLEAQGFARQAIRTDYQFTSVAEAEELTRFFFGDELADRVVREQAVIVPECTGVWSRTLA